MDSRMFNANLVDLLGQPGGREKIAQAARDLVKDHIEESGYTRKVVPPKPAPQPLQVSTAGHETLHAVLELPPNARAMQINFRGDTPARVIRGPKVAVGFTTIQTEKYSINEHALMAYSNPIITIIEEKIPTAIEGIEDRIFTQYAEAAVQAVQLEANGGVATALNSVTIAAGAVEDGVVKGETARVAPITTSSVPFPLQRPDIVRLKKLFPGTRQLRADTILISEFDFADVLQWTIDDLGSQLTGETLRDGYKVPTIFGSRVVMTLKTRILRPGNIYAFAPPDTLGVFYTLNDVKFFMDKRGREIEFWAWEDIGMCLANVRAVAKLELYPGDANPATDVDGILSDVVPMPELEVTVLNNRVDAGVYTPVLHQF